ncbi:UNVERIFIED_ORG: hypothetical protein FHW05_002381 [Pantoea agglomerans]
MREDSVSISSFALSFLFEHWLMIILFAIATYYSYRAWFSYHTFSSHNQKHIEAIRIICTLAFIVMISIIGFNLHKDWKNAQQDINYKSNVPRRF